MPKNTLWSRSVRVGAVTLALSVTSLGLTACGGESAEPAADNIVIFQTNSFSGQVSNKPQTKTGAQAAVDEINKAGGINGRRLELVTCDNTGDPNVTNTCLKKAQEVKAAAFVGSAIYFPATWKLLEQANIPYLLGTGLTPDEYKAKNSFPLSGQAGWYYGIADYLKQLGVSHPAIIRCEIDACAYGETLLAEALKQQGMPEARSVVAPLSTTDYSSFAAAAMRGDTDAVVVTGSEATATSEAKALYQQGFKGKVISVSACISTPAVPNLGDAGKDLYVVGLLQPPTLDTPLMRTFTQSMDAVDKGAKKDELALSAYAGVKLFAELAKGLSEVNATTVLDALQNAKAGAYDIGFTAPLPGATTSPIAELPQLKFSPTVTYSQILDGTIKESVAGFHNPFVAA
ncbi:ABC transporter substrate-binding protein [Sphaerisporangium viridialbum]|uniref:ABC transporter substrate-binding protein n=1 Tax=Sphaerisporangium viridialbum TaxID=46189 RepID=UPI003C7963DE